ncbi:hypothetical protein PybrP1_001303 [[Pythium] brassicae (nom. inval.)]|nr:hypothetical protein PybrP1_001303 [[Pythium] brassicae (nom. inval.)]
MARGGAFGLRSEREPTLRELGGVCQRRMVSMWRWLLALALLLYVAALWAFFGGAPQDVAVQLSPRVAKTAAPTATPDTLPPQELAAISKLLQFTPPPPATAEIDDTAPNAPLEPAVAASEVPAETESQAPTTQWSAAGLAEQADREAAPQNVLAAVASALPSVAFVDKDDAREQAVRAKATQEELVSAVITAALAPFTAKKRSEWTVDDHGKELQRLQILRDAAQAEVNRLQAILDSAKKLHAAEATEYESLLATRAVDIRKAVPRRVRENLRCLGWKQTGSCGPYGTREPAQDRACNQLIMGGVSGYCELLDADTGEYFRAMQLNCSSVRDHVAFSCTNAADFANFGVRSEAILAAAQSQPLASLPGAKGSGNGIVIVVYPKLMASAYATIRLLRAFGCTLPVELWVLESEMARNPKKSDILVEIQEVYGPVRVKTIKDPLVTGFTTKIHAIYHSDFANVLFLDADNVPVRDPTYLFELPEFTRFCGMTMVQYDPSGAVLFLHRNAKKLNGRVGQLDDEFWNYMQIFDWNYVDPGKRDAENVGTPEPTHSSGLADSAAESASAPGGAATASPPKMSYEELTRKYTIGIQSSAPHFREFQSCYGAEPVAYPYFNLTAFDDLPFAGIEKQIIAYAHEAALLTRRARQPKETSRKQ